MKGGLNILTVNELFSGIGAQRKALENIGANHKVIGISEIDKYAIASYTAIYGETPNYGDISKIEKLNYADLWTYSFPCTDISTAGKQAGLAKGSNTRSGLLWEVERLLNTAKENSELPKFLLLENVKNLVGKRFIDEFNTWCHYLTTLGYSNYWQVLNAKDYGIPQNRERVFMVSIHDDVKMRYSFPKKILLTKTLADILEPKVRENFYIRQELDEIFKWQICNKVISNSVRVGGRGSFDKHSWDLVAEEINLPVIGGSRGRICSDGFRQQQFEMNPANCSNTLTTVTKDNLVLQYKDHRIRRLTPKECWRLMGFDDESFAKANRVCSDSQLYKQAGNSIVVPVLEAILKPIAPYGASAPLVYAAKIFGFHPKEASSSLV